jgi:hypothetical protein
MTASDHDPILDAFDRRLAAVERFIPVERPLSPPTRLRQPIRVVGGTAIRHGPRPGSRRLVRTALAPIGVAAAVMVAVIGLGLLDRPAIGPGAASPSSAAAARCAGPPISGSPQPVLSPCQYRSSAFQPALELTFGAGWAPVIDTDRELSIQTSLAATPRPEVGTLTIATIDDVAVNPCGASGVAGPTRPWTPAAPADGPQAFMDWIESDSGVPHSPPSQVTIDGHPGFVTTLSPGVGSLQPCGGVAFLSDLGTPGRSLQIRENEGMRVAAIVVGDRTVVVVTDVPRAAMLGDFATTADGVIATLVFR